MAWPSPSPCSPAPSTTPTASTSPRFSATAIQSSADTVTLSAPCSRASPTPKPSSTARACPRTFPAPRSTRSIRTIAHAAAANNWAVYRRHAGIGTHLLAGFIFIVPKVGPLSDLSLRGPTAKTEQDYVNSLVHTAAVLRQTLANATTSGDLPNQDLDTGYDVRPGTYSLEDYTYADLLHQMTRDPASPIPFGIKRDLLAYFADLAKVKYIQSDPKRLAGVQADLPILQTISTKAAYPDTAFLPEPNADKPPNPQPTPETSSPSKPLPLPVGPTALVPIPPSNPSSAPPKPQP